MITSLARLFGIGLLLTAWAGGSLFAAGVKGRPIEYSKPQGEAADQAEEQLTPGQTRLGHLESELSRPFEGLAPGNSLGGMILPAPLPMPPPAVQSPKARELSNKQRDWMFQAPEELLGIQTVEDKYKAPELTPDGRDRNRIRPMERALMNTFESSSPQVTNRSTPGLVNPFDAGVRSALPGLEAPTPFPGQLNADTTLESAFGWNADMLTPRATEGADFFKFNNGVKAPTQPTPSELQYQEQIRQIYNFGDATPSSGDASMNNYNLVSPYVDRSFYDPPKPAAPAPTASLRGGLSDNGAGSLPTPSWMPAASPPLAAPARSVAPPASPFMNLPRQNF